MPRWDPEGEIYRRRANATRQYIIDHTNEKGYPPSIRDVASFLGVVPSTGLRIVDQMVEDGLLIKPPGVARQLRVTETVLPEKGATA